MKRIERQNLSNCAIREMCKENNLYTRGTIEQYEAMLGMVIALYSKSISTADGLAPIAVNILSHNNGGRNMEDILCGLGNSGRGYFLDAALSGIPCGR